LALAALALVVFGAYDSYPVVATNLFGRSNHFVWLWQLKFLVETKIFGCGD